jgi:hypothetical protein
MESAVISPSIQARIAELDERLDTFIEDEVAQVADEKNDNKIFLGILRDACDLVRNSGGNNTVDGALVARVDELINKAVDFGYGDEGNFDFIPSFAHSNRDDCPEVKDTTEWDFAGFCTSIFILTF